MDLGLKDRVVVITGGTTGIGRTLAEAFLAEGCKVSVCGRNPEHVAKVRQELPHCHVMEADAASGADMNELARDTADRFGGLDVWINNAGISPRATLLDMAEADWDAVMRVNLKGVFLGTRAAVPYMEQRGGGVVINASSFTSLMPTALSGAYSATKAGVNALTSTFAAELASRNIRVVAYIPGMIAVPRMAARMNADHDSLLSPIALGRFGTPEDIAPAVVFLASDKAGYITGTCLPITGGKYCVQNVSAVRSRASNID